MSSDQDRAGPQADVVIDRDAAARLGVRSSAIDNALNNAFAQRQISIIYTARNQYRVVLEVDPALQADPSSLDRIFVGAAGGTQVPLLSVVRLRARHRAAGGAPPGPVPGRHDQLQHSRPGVAQGDAHGGGASRPRAICACPRRCAPSSPATRGGCARAWPSQPFLIAAALLAIYIVLGVLYESLTAAASPSSPRCPRPGLGALLALLVTGTDLSIMGIIGIMLLMGIVKKNAIMMVDFALEQERQHGLTPLEAIHAACLERFRPIIMTTLAALLGAVPLAVAFGAGGGTAPAAGHRHHRRADRVSQALTLYTTPVVYLALQRRRRAAAAPVVAE